MVRARNSTMTQRERAKSLIMKWPLLLLVLWMTIYSGDAASNSLVSSVEEDGRESACPGEVVRYTCTVVDTSDPLIGTTLWRGSAFDCDPDDEIQLNHQDFNTTGDSGVCGDLTGQSEGQDDTCFTSVLTLPEADEGMSGKTIECTLSGAVSVGSDTVAVASCPAPNITITELTPMSVNVSIDGYPEDTLLCSYTLMGNVTDESGQIVQTFSITNETSVIVDGLNLCNSYTFEVYVMCGNVVSDITTMEFNATLISCPAPNITITELTPVSVNVSIDGYPQDTLLCSYTLMGNVTDESGQIVQTFTITNETSVIVDGLNLCNSYTFEVFVMCGNVVSDCTTMEFNATLISLDCNTNLRCDGMCDDNPQTLIWDAPTNLPDGCNVAYEIEVDGVLMTTTMATSFSVADLGLPPCGVYTVTVTPTLTDRIGLLERCSSEVTITLTQGLPSPTITSVDFVYRQQDIMVTINWQGEVATLIDVVMVECSMAVCQSVSLTNPMGTYSTNLDYSGVIGGSVDFTVFFINDPCVTIIDTTTTNFPYILESARASRTDTISADILVVYNNDVMLEGTFVLRATITERGTDELTQMNETFPLTPAIGTTNQFVFMFTGLTEGATYDLDVRVENEDGQTIGRAESGSFTAIEEPSSSSPTAAIGGAVGAVVVIVLVVLVVNLVLILLLYWGSLLCCLVKPSEVEAGKGSTSGAFDDQENRVYKIHTCILILLVVLVITLPFVIYFYCCWRKKSGSPKTDDKVELKSVRTGSDSGDTRSSPEATAEAGGGDLNYAVPSDIKREEYPGTHDEYALVDKSRKKLKPEDTQPTYAAPETIPRERAPETGDVYTMPDKPKRGSRKQAPPAPPPQEAAPMYSEVDKSKKQPGVQYADVELPGSNTAPPRPPRVDYSSVQY